MELTNQAMGFTDEMFPAGTHTCDPHEFLSSARGAANESERGVGASHRSTEPGTC